MTKSRGYNTESMPKNVIGGNRGMIHQLLWRLQRFATRSGGVGRISQQLSDLLDIHGEILTYEQRSQVERLLAGKTSLVQRLKNCIVPPATRQSWIDQLLLRGILLTNRF
jgi:hypothetical protein